MVLECNEAFNEGDDVICGHFLYMGIDWGGTKLGGVSAANESRASTMRNAVWCHQRLSAIRSGMRGQTEMISPMHVCSSCARRNSISNCIQLVCRGNWVGKMYITRRGRGSYSTGGLSLYEPYCVMNG